MIIETISAILLEQGMITAVGFEKLVSIQEEKSFFETLISDHYLTIQDLGLVLNEHYGIATVCLSEVPVSPDARKLLDHTTADAYTVFPVSISADGKELVLAMSNPFDFHAIADVELITKHHISPVFSQEKEIHFFINKYYSAVHISSIASQFVIEERLKNITYQVDPKIQAELENAPAVKLIDSVIRSATLSHASDIHIEPSETVVRTRYRIDGDLEVSETVDISLHPYIISRLKIMGRMNISEKRLPQDGHFKLELEDVKIDFRISTIPTIYGEKAAIRLIYSNMNDLDKHSLGFFEDDLDKISLLFKNAHGAVLVTGPTGSGKTTTLATFLKELNTDKVNIVTIEDPVEIVIGGVNHVNVNPKAGLDFANALRAIVRQDPDVVMVGEIRDSETADIAIRAAMTGRLVLTTVHANDAVGSIMRLVDMGTDWNSVIATVRGVISQRLVKRICPFCKREVPILKKDALVLGLPEHVSVYEGTGCSQCNHTGYKGRFAIYEYFIIDDDFRRAMENNTSSEKIKSFLLEKGLATIWNNAIQNVMLGNTTISEMYRAVFEM